MKNRKELVAILSNIIVKESNTFWIKTFENATFPFAPINNMQEVFDDPHIKEIGLVKTLNHKTAGKVKVVGPPVVYSGARNEARNPPPTLGEHTDHVLKDILEYDDEKICYLKKKGIIQ